MIEGFPGLIAIAMIGIAGVVMVRAFGPRKTRQRSRSDDSGTGIWSSGNSSGSSFGSSSSESSNHDGGSAADTGSSDSGGGGDGGGGGGN